MLERIGLPAPLPPRPAKSLRSMLKDQVAIGVAPSSSPEKRLPQSIVESILRVRPSQEEVQSAECRLSRWSANQVLRNPVVQQVEQIDAFFYAAADQLLNRIAEKAWAAAKARGLPTPKKREGYPYPDGPQWWEVEGMTRLNVTLDEANRPVDIAITRRSLSYPWLSVSQPVVLERIFDGAAMDHAKKRSYAGAPINEKDGKRQVIYELVWRLID